MLPKADGGSGSDEESSGDSDYSGDDEKKKKKASLLVAAGATDPKAKPQAAGVPGAKKVITAVKTVAK